MRVLAHYTIFGEEIFNLHTFEIEGKNIKHGKVVEETAHTEFIQGLLIFACSITNADITEINSIAAKNKTGDIRIIAEKIATYLKENKKSYSINKDFTLLKSTYPDYILSKL